MVDVRDVATAMINAVEQGRRGERYIVSTGYVTPEWRSLGSAGSVEARKTSAEQGSAPGPLDEIWLE